MKIIISSSGETIADNVDMRFGRCQYFLIVEAENNKINNVLAVQNQGVIQGHGAGIKAASQVGELKPDAVITGNLGPKATDVLNQFNIEVYQGSGKIEDAVMKLLDGNLEKLKEIAQPHSGSDTEQNVPNERVYFPLLDNSGMDSQISGHFGHAPFFGLYDFKTGDLTITGNTLDHSNPNKSPIDQIVEAVNPTMIFAQGIGGRAVGIIKEKGLKLKTGSFATVKEVIDNFDSLSDEVQGCGHHHH